MLHDLGSVIVLLGLLVFVHELGHFLVAKAVGVKVLRFSIGFGPKLVGFTKGDTEYWIAALPLGGYVKMAGEMPGEDTSPEDEARSYLAQSPWKRMLIVIAGPAFNLIFPLLVLFLAVVSFPQPSTRILALEPGLPAAEAGMKLGDVITEVDGRSVHTFEEMRRVIEPRAGQRVPVVVERDGRSLTLLLTPARNPEWSPGRPKGMLGISPTPGRAWLGIPAGSAAEKLGLRTFDRVVSVDGQPVTDQPSLLRRIDASSGPEIRLEVLRRDPAGVPGVDLEVPRTLRFTVPRQPGTGLAALGVESADLYVGRVLEDSSAAKAGVQAGDRLLAIDGEPLRSYIDAWHHRLEAAHDKPFQLSWLHQGVEKKAEVRQVKVTRKDDFTGQEVSGLELGLRPGAMSNAEKSQMDLVRVGPGEALVIASRMLLETVAATAGGLAMLLTGQVSLKSVGGPIMIYEIAGKAAQAGLEPFLKLMAAISVNLGLINLVPIPALDGFQLLSSAWEAVRRRPIPMRAREIANAVGILALIALMVLVCVNDLTR
jgi:regulator of sigma E protease